MLVVRVRVDRRHEPVLDARTRRCSTFAIGATQFVVHDAFEMIACCSRSYWSSFTPSTTVMSGSVAGAEMTTFFGAGVEVLLRAVALVKKPVDSSTTSTPSSPQGSCGRVALGQRLQLVAVDVERRRRRARRRRGTARAPSRA